jgi:hypothetical protein
MSARRALLVGVAEYDHAGELPHLATPANDIAELGRVIAHSNCGFDVKSLLNPTANDLSVAIASLLRNTRSEDTVLFYYSGHGKLAQTGGLRLCTRDTREEDVDIFSVGVGWIKEKIDSTKAARVILLLDCCYSGLAAGAFKGDVVSAIRDAVGSGKGKFVVTSSSRAELSIELAGDRNSLFTKWLVNGLDSFEADLNKDGVITLDELVEYTSKKVQQERSEQHPQALGFETTGGLLEIARRPGGTLEQPAPTLEWLSTVLEDIRDKAVIFFLGSGVYGSGPLSNFELINAVGREATLDLTRWNSLATAAEYRLRLLGSRRANFLDRYGDIVSTQSAHRAPPAVHEMLAKLDPPWLVISATHDLLFEELLEQRAVPYVLVAHILGPEGSGHVGKILVLRRGAEPKIEVSNSDELRIDLLKDRVVYKLLGSPCLSELATTADEFDLSDFDTAVVTEEDHIAFLGDLHSKRTSIPTAFSRRFRKSSVLFLGYNLDTWNYRLVAQVCLAENVRRERLPLYAVRQPTSSFERVFWEQLHTRMLEVDVDTFIQSLEAARAGA